MFVDAFVQNEGWGQETLGNALEVIADRGQMWDPGLMRPFINSKGNACVTVNTGRKAPRKDPKGGGFITNQYGQPSYFPVLETQTISERLARGLPVPTINAGNLLTKEAWVMLDNVVLEAARDRLRAWADLRAANTYGGFDGMANPILEFERSTDVGEAMEDMDGMTEGRSFAPKFDLQGMPLPITHSDFFLSSRFLAVSKNKGTPMDTTRAEMAGRRIGEHIEKVTIGITEGTTYGESASGTTGKYAYANDSQVFGYLNHPDISSGSGYSSPTGANGTTVLTNWLVIREALYTNKFFGPYIVYTSTDWDQYLDNLFSTVEPSAGTLRKRLLEIEDIQDIRRLDYLTSAAYPFRTIWIQMKPETARAVNGMEVTTVQWPSMGGMRLNFKVMCIQVPQIRSRFTGPNTTTAATGIYVATHNA